MGDGHEPPTALPKSGLGDMHVKDQAKVAQQFTDVAVGLLAGPRLASISGRFGHDRTVRMRPVRSAAGSVRV